MENKNTKPNFFYFQFLLGVLILVSLPFLFIKSQIVDPDEHARTLHDLGDLKKLNAIVAEELIETRFGMLSNYDEIVEAINTQVSVSQKFRDNISKGFVQTINRDFQSYNELLSLRSSYIEDFKSHNAVLKNSLSYLPKAVDNFLIRKNKNRPVSLQQNLKELVNHILQFNLNSGFEHKEEAQKNLEFLNMAIDVFQGETREEFDFILKHATVSLDYKTIVDDLVKTSYKVPTEAAIESIYQSYMSAYNAKEKNASIYRLFLFAVSCILVLWVGITLFRLNKSSSKLKQTLHQLEFQQFALNEHAIVSIADFKGDITYVNDKFCEISQYTEEQLLGKNHRFVKSDEHSDGFFAEMWHTIANGEVWHGEIKNSAKNGDVYWVSSTIVPFLNEKGKPFQYISIRTDITQRKEAEANVSKAYESLEKITNTMGEGLYVLDEHGKCTLINKAAEEMLGWINDELIHKPIHDLIHFQDTHGNHISAQECPTYKSIQQGKVFRSDEEVFTRKDGSTFDTAITSVPIKENDKIVGSVAVFQNITERKKAAFELAVAKEEAEKASKLKSDFLANMSHEIRTPMNAILGFSHLALQTALSPQQTDYLSKIKSSSNALLRIINDILDFSKIEAGKLTIEEAEFNLDELLNEISSLNYLSAEKKNLEILISKNVNIPSYLVGDALRIGQVLTNLINNAIKFTDEGTIRLFVAKEYENRDSITLSFSVSDTGIGIEHDKITALFDSFSQADASTTRKYGGTGLGLAICKKLVNLMGGQIQATSEIGKGSNFSFTVLLKHSMKSQEELFYPHNLTGKNAVIYSSNLSISENLEATLRSFGLEAKRFASVSEIYDQIDKNRALNKLDIVILSPLEKGTKSLEVIKHIDTLSRGAKKPLTILTVSANMAISEIDNFAFVKKLTKPVAPSILLETIQEHFYPTFKAEAKSLEQNTSTLMNEFMGSQILLVEDNKINQQIATELMEEYGVIITIANNGQEALNELDENTFDLVFMDIQMPVMDGFETTKHIRTDERFKTLPVIAMTAHALKSDVEECLSKGMNDHLSKPLNPTELFETLSKWLPPQTISFNNQNDVQGKTEKKPINLKGLDVSVGLKVTNNDMELYQSIVEQFKNTHFQDHATILNDLKQGDTQKALICSHTLKSVADAIGALDLSATAATIETALRNNQNVDIPQTEEKITQNMLELQSSIHAFLDEIPIKKDGPENIEGLNIELTIEQLSTLSELIKEGDLTSLENIKSLKTSGLSDEFKKLITMAKSDIEAFDFTEAQEHIELAMGLLKQKAEGAIE